MMFFDHNTIKNLMRCNNELMEVCKITVNKTKAQDCSIVFVVILVRQWETSKKKLRESVTLKQKNLELCTEQES